MRLEREEVLLLRGYMPWDGAKLKLKNACTFSSSLSFLVRGGVTR